MCYIKNILEVTFVLICKIVKKNMLELIMSVTHNHKYNIHLIVLGIKGTYICKYVR